MKKIWKENAKLILAIFVTVVIASGATYATTTMYQSNIVGYDNTTSGLRSTNVQSALDELYGNIADVILNIKNLIGNSTLTTSEQTLTGAINELDGQVESFDGILKEAGFKKVVYSAFQYDIAHTDVVQLIDVSLPGYIPVLAIVNPGWYQANNVSCEIFDVTWLRITATNVVTLTTPGNTTGYYAVFYISA